MSRNKSSEHWSEKEFAEEIAARMLWSSSAKMYLFDYESLRELANDPRAPEYKADKLKDMLNEWEKLNERIRRL